MAETVDRERKVVLDRSDGIATVWLDNPVRLNALPFAAWQQIVEVAREVERDPSVGVVVIRGRGQRAFSAGADITEFEEHHSTPETSRAYSDVVRDATQAVLNISKPVIAMTHGYCLGGGCEIAICSDLRIASQDAQFGIPAARIGHAVHMEDIRRLVELVGPSNAKLILFAGLRVPADRALQIGLVNEVVPTAELEARTYELAETIRRAAPTSVRWAKRVVAEVVRDPSLESYPDRHERASALFETEDFAEGVRAFMEKREPRFTGR